MVQCTAALLLAGAFASVPAARAEPIDPAFEARIDYFQSSVDSSVRFDSQLLGIGTDLDLEEDLGIEDSADVIRAELLFRTGERSHITIDYTSFDRDGSGVVGRDFQFGDFVFSASAEVEASVETQFAALGWRYDFVPAETSELGLSLSVAWVAFDAAVRGQVLIAGIPALVVEESGSVEGPLPMLGLHWSVWLDERFRLSASGRYLEVSELGGWGGSAFDASARFEWFVTRNFAIGVGYSTTTLEGESTDPEEDGLTKAESTHDGFRAGVTLAF